MKTEDVLKFLEWCAINYVPTIQKGEVKYWQEGYYQSKKYCSSEQLLEIFKHENKTN